MTHVNIRIGIKKIPMVLVIAEGLRLFMCTYMCALVHNLLVRGTKTYTVHWKEEHSLLWAV